jgi:6-phosphogluconate dehydrogenase
MTPDESGKFVQLAMVGLGRMGAPMARRLAEAGHTVVGLDVAPEAREHSRAAGIATTDDLATLISGLGPDPVLWMMLPAGEPTAAMIEQLAGALVPGALVVDGGNSDWRDAAGREAVLSATGVRFVDVGVSGGRWGWRHGYGLTVGGTPADFERLRPALTALAAPDAVALVGSVGAGHFVKAVHNGVEYGLMQAYAEGFALLSANGGIDPVTALRVWQGGCSVRSFVLQQIVDALTDDPTLTGFAPVVADSGMGRWAQEEAIRLGVSTPVLTAGLQARFVSRDTNQLANRLLAASRAQIGGHASSASPHQTSFRK